MSDNPGWGFGYVPSVAQWGVALAGAIINIANFPGADPTGVADSTAAVQAAASAVPATGGVLTGPAGAVFLLSAPVYLQAGTTLRDIGFIQAPVWVGVIPTTSPLLPGFTPGAVANWLISNQNWFVATGTAPVDTDISVINCDFTLTVTSYFHAIQFRKVQTVRIRDCWFEYGNNGTALMACIDQITDGCVAFNTDNCAFDHWEGPQDVTVSNCTAYLNGAGTGTQVNGSQIAQSAVLDAEKIELFNNRFFSPGVGVPAIYADPLASSGYANTLGRVRIKDNYVYLSVNGSYGIVARGYPGYLDVSHNTIECAASGLASAGPLQVARGSSVTPPAPLCATIKDNIFINPTCSGGANVISVADFTDIIVADNIAENGSYPYLLSYTNTTGLVARGNVGAAWTAAKYLNGGGNTAVQISDTGTWTPTLAFGGASSGIVYSAQSGEYSQINNILFWSFSLTITASGTSTGELQVAGLPTVAANSLGIGQLTNYNGLTGLSGTPVAYFAGSNEIIFRQSAAEAASYLSNANIGGSATLSGNGWYFTS